MLLSSTKNFYITWCVFLPLWLFCHLLFLLTLAFLILIIESIFSLGFLITRGLSLSPLTFFHPIIFSSSLLLVSLAIKVIGDPTSVDRLAINPLHHSLDFVPSLPVIAEGTLSETAQEAILNLWTSGSQAESEMLNRMLPANTNVFQTLIQPDPHSAAGYLSRFGSPHPSMICGVKASPVAGFSVGIPLVRFLGGVVLYVVVKAIFG